MKLLICAFISLFSLSTLAASIKINSFYFIRSGEPLAELCGTVTDGANPTFIRVIVDSGSRKPGIYNTIAGSDGKFCLPMITYYGKAEASIMGEEKKVEALVK